MTSLSHISSYKTESSDPTKYSLYNRASHSQTLLLLLLHYHYYQYCYCFSSSLGHIDYRLSFYSPLHYYWNLCLSQTDKEKPRQGWQRRKKCRIHERYVPEKVSMCDGRISNSSVPLPGILLSSTVQDAIKRDFIHRRMILHGFL